MSTWRKLRDQHIHETTTGNRLVDLKEELFLIVVRASGLSPASSPEKVFFLHTPSLGVMCIIFVTHIRLDESNATLVADTCILPLTTESVMKLGSELYGVQTKRAVTVRCSEESY